MSTMPEESGLQCADQYEDDQNVMSGETPSTEIRLPTSQHEMSVVRIFPSRSSLYRPPTRRMTGGQEAFAIARVKRVDASIEFHVC